MRELKKNSCIFLILVHIEKTRRFFQYAVTEAISMRKTPKKFPSILIKWGLTQATCSHNNIVFTYALFLVYRASMGNFDCDYR